METELRAMIVAAASAIAIALTAVPASAAPNPHQAAGFDGASSVQLVAQGCGAGWHRRPGWRDQYGNWHPGHCVPN
jgi:hypothetical protein